MAKLHHTALKLTFNKRYFLHKKLHFVDFFTRIDDPEYY